MIGAYQQTRSEGVEEGGLRDHRPSGSHSTGCCTQSREQRRHLYITEINFSRSWSLEVRLSRCWHGYTRPVILSCRLIISPHGRRQELPFWGLIYRGTNSRGKGSRDLIPSQRSQYLGAIRFSIYEVSRGWDTHTHTSIQPQHSVNFNY